MDITPQSEFITRLYSLIQENLLDNNSQEISAEKVREVVYRVADTIFANGIIKVNSKENEPPAIVYQGDIFLVGDNPSGGFSSKAGYIARYNESRAWEFIQPLNGMSVITKDGSHWYFYRNSSWSDLLVSLLTQAQMEALNSGATSSLINKISVPSDFNKDGDIYSDGIKNRTHWVDVSESDFTTLIDDITYIRSRGFQLVNNHLISQKILVEDEIYTVHVFFGGEETQYQVECTTDVVTGHTQLRGAFSEALDGAYFDMDYPYNNNLKLYAGNSGITSDYKFKITSISEVFHSIDERFIPDTIARSSQILGKIDKIPLPVQNNIPIINPNGGITDSGKNISSIVTEDQIPHDLFGKVVLNGNQDDFVISGTGKIFTFFYDTQKVPIIRSSDLQYFVNGVELCYVAGGGAPDYNESSYGPVNATKGAFVIFTIRIYNTTSDSYGKVEVRLASGAPSEFDCIIQYKDNICKKQMDASYIPKEITLSKIIVIEDADVLMGLQPDKEYNFSSNNLSSLTFTLNPSTDSGVSHEYKGSFNTGGTIPSLTLPQGVTWLGGTPTLAANKHYEFSIINNYGVMVEF